MSDSCTAQLQKFQCRSVSQLPEAYLRKDADIQTMLQLHCFQLCIYAYSCDAWHGFASVSVKLWDPCHVWV